MQNKNKVAKTTTQNKNKLQQQSVIAKLTSSPRTWEADTIIYDAQRQATLNLKQ